MERRLKERLTGAIVLVVVAVIFIPMLLDNSARNDMEITATNIPPAPAIEFRDTVLPVEEPVLSEPPRIAVEPAPMSPTDVPNAGTPESAIPSVAVAEETVPGNVAPTAISDPAQSAPAEPPASSAGVEQTPSTARQTGSDDSRRNLSAWVIQLGSFSSRQNAESLIKQLQSNGFPGYIEQVKSGTETVYKVRVGPELSRTEAESIQKNLKSRMNIDAIILRFP